MSLNCIDFNIKRGSLYPALDAILKDENDEVFSLSGATSAMFIMRPLQTQTAITGSATIVDSSAGHVRYEWNSGDTDIAGYADAEFKVFFGSEPMSFPSDGYVTINITESLI